MQVCQAKRMDHCQSWRKAICIQIVQAVSYLHLQHMAHRDVCADNVYVSGVSSGSASADVWVRLADLGNASLLLPSARCPIDLGRRPTYHQAPEILMDGIWDEKMDVWSCGVLVAFSVMGRLPWHPSSGAISTIRHIMKAIGAPPPDVIRLLEVLPGWQPSLAVGTPCAWHEHLLHGLGPFQHSVEAMLAWAPSRQRDKVSMMSCLLLAETRNYDCKHNFIYNLHTKGCLLPPLRLRL